MFEVLRSQFWTLSMLFDIILFDIKDKMYNEIRQFITELIDDRTDIYRWIDNPKSITYWYQIVRAMSIVISTTTIKSSSWSSSEVISVESSSSTRHNYHHYRLSSRISIIIIIRSRISEIIIIIVIIVHCPEESSSSLS